MVVVGVRVRWAGRATGAAYLYVCGGGGWHGDHVIRLLTGFRRRTARVAGCGLPTWDSNAQLAPAVCEYLPLYE